MPPMSITARMLRKTNVRPADTIANPVNITRIRRRVRGSMSQ